MCPSALNEFSLLTWKILVVQMQRIECLANFIAIAFSCLQWTLQKIRESWFKRIERGLPIWRNQTIQATLRTFSRDFPQRSHKATFAPQKCTRRNQFRLQPIVKLRSYKLYLICLIKKINFSHESQKNVWFNLLVNFITPSNRVWEIQ